MLEEEGRQPILPEIDELGETYGRLPFSDLKRWTEEGDIYERAFENLPLGRLAYVKALSFLSYEEFDPKYAIFAPYPHTRFEHAFVVSLVSGEILKLNGFSQQDINTGIIAGLVHDNATPAFGDATKKVDPKALDEERFWWQSINKKGRDFITKELKIQRKMLDQLIKNKGILGQVLDIADRITYTMIDLDAVIPKKPLSSTTSYDELRLSALRQLLSDYPKIGNICKEVVVDRNKQKIFFSNPEHLGIFLLLRAHLHQALYLKPANQGRDLFVAKVLSSLYSRTDSNAPLTPQRLREMTDEDLLAILQKHYKPQVYFPQEIYRDLVEWHPEFGEFGKNHLARAKQFAEELKKKKNMVLVGIHKCKGFDPTTSYNVIDKSGNIMPFKNFDPELALKIEEIAMETKRVYVFYTDISKESGAATNLLESVFVQKSGL